jgi:hypothetical protein
MINLDDKTDREFDAEVAVIAARFIAELQGLRLSQALNVLRHTKEWLLSSHRVTEDAVRAICEEIRASGITVETELPLDSGQSD